MANTAPLILTDHIQVNISIRLGSMQMTVGEVSALQMDDILTMEESIEDGVDLCVGDAVVARGEIIRDDSSGKLAIKILGEDNAG